MTEHDISFTEIYNDKCISIPDTGQHALKQNPIKLHSKNQGKNHDNLIVKVDLNNMIVALREYRHLLGGCSRCHGAVSLCPPAQVLW